MSPDVSRHPQFTIITQTQYESTHKFKPQPPISFLDKDGHPTLLWVMLQKEFSRPDWERPCPLKAVDRRVFLRVRIEESGRDLMLATSCLTFNHSVSCRTRAAREQSIDKFIPVQLPTCSTHMRNWGKSLPTLYANSVV